MDMQTGRAATPHRTTHLPWRNQLLIVGASAGILLAGTAIAAVSSILRDPTPAQPTRSTPGTFRPTPAEYAGLAVRPVGQFAPGDATVQATGVIDVDADHSTPVVAPYAGQVLRVMAELGQTVTKGEPLLIIRGSEFVEARDAVVSASAQNQTAIAQLQTAQANAERQAQLYQTAGGALKDLQQARRDLVEAQGGARAAAASLNAARGKLSVMGKSAQEIAHFERGTERANAASALRAPISGVVADRSVASGQYVGAGGDKPLFVVTDPSSVWLVAQVPESDAANVHRGDRVQVTTPAWPGRRFEARIAQVGAALDPDTHRLPVRATIANPDGALKPRMFASFTILHEQPAATAAVLIPASAVIYEGDAARVWVAGAGLTLRPRTITVASRENGMVRVLSGLRRGERIVTAGAIFVNEAGSAD